MLKSCNHSITTRNNAVTYYQTLDEIPRHLGLIKLKQMSKIFKKLEKTAKENINLRF